MVFVQKWPFFQLLFFSKYTPGKCLLQNSRTKNAFLGYKNKKFKKSKNRHFSKRVNPCFQSRNGHFSNFQFLENIDQENLFYGILERKDVFLGFKNKKLEIRKIDIFPKRLTHGFGTKMAIFPTFIFWEIYVTKMSFRKFYNEKRPFQAIKTTSSKSREIDIFAKGLPHGFGPKWPFFQLLFFRKYRLGKCLLRYSRTKKRLSRH